MKTTPKLIPATTVIGQRGVNLVECIVLGMGCAWHPTGSLEAGIDGFIELSDPATHQALNLWIPVQVKARSEFVNETPDGFAFICDERDVEYWLRGNAKVVLIVCRPDTDEAYWVSVNDYFSSPEKRKARRIHFNKARDRFDQNCLRQLMTEATPRDAGIYLAPLPQRERLYSNLLDVAHIPSVLHVAETALRTPEEAWRELHRLGGSYGPEWLLKSNRLWSFWDLSEYPWRELIDVGTLDALETEEWVASDPPATQRDLVQLLNYCLRALVGDRLRYDRKRAYFYFPPSETGAPARYPYSWRRRRSALTVFRSYHSRTEPARTAYCRHMAFVPQFRQLDGDWYLEIMPTYHFTRDGHRPYRYYEDRLRRIKQIERQPRVLAQVIMWADFLCSAPGLFESPYEFLRFGSLLAIDAPVSIDDKAWLPVEDSAARQALHDQVRQLPLLRGATWS